MATNELKKAAQKRRTANNKIKRITKSLNETNNEEHKMRLQARIEFWKKQL